MKLLVGLGNPGREHLLNRHNLGFLVVDSWVLLKQEEFKKQEFRADIARVKLQNEDVLVMKPLTFMNRSGDSVAEAMQFYNIPLEDVIVVHDELDILPKTFRIKRGGGHGGHNGLRSILHLGEQFLRFRMGIGRPLHPEMSVADYVLGNLDKLELDFWEKEMPNVCEAIDLCIQDKVELAMNRFHRKGEKNGS